MTVEDILGKNSDFKKHRICGEFATFTVYYIDGTVDTEVLSRLITDKLKNIKNLEKAVEDGTISFCSAEKAENAPDAAEALVRGKAAVEQAGGSTYVFDVRNMQSRSVSQPSEENAVKASKDSFVEEVKTNITLLRKKIASPNLMVENIKIGRQSATTVSLVYMSNIASNDLTEKIRDVLNSIDIDGIITPGVIEQYFSKNLFTLFPQTVETERPDKVCRSLLLGRAAIIADGIPLAYILPATAAQFLSTPEDYSGNFIFASVVRALRYFLLFIEIFLPGGYVALTTFHFEMIPGKLALSIAETRSGVPFPVVCEVLAMLALFEVLIEAGRHMPQSSGQAVSIVGALVVGEAAISADLVSPATLIIVAVSAICSFAMPNQEFSNALRLWRVLLTVFGELIGLFGIVAGGLLLLLRISMIESFGVPYLAPFAGVKKIRFKDSFAVIPDKYNVFRPEELNTKNKRRTK